MPQEYVVNVRKVEFQAMLWRWVPAAFALVFQAQAQAQYGGPPSVGRGGEGQGWRITPSLTIGEIYTDNIGLAPSGSERSEWTTRISPGVSVSHNSARLTFRGTYAPELLYRASQGTNDISHSLSAVGTAELWSRKLFLDIRAGVSQQNVSLLGPLAESNVNVTQNRTTTRTYSVSPYLRHEFGVDAVGELRLSHDAVSYGSGGGAVSNSTSERVDAKLGSGPAYRLLVWNIAFSRFRVDYSRNIQQVDGQSYSLSAGRLITPDLRLNASYGYEDSGYPSTAGRNLKGTFWSVGPEWTPTERTRVAGTIGHRYFGPARTLSVSHRARLTFIGLEYNESVTTTRDNLTIPTTLDVAGFVNALCRLQPNPVQCLQNFSGLPPTLSVPLEFLTDSLFQEKRLQATVGFQGVKNTITTNVFSSDRNAITTAAGGALADFNASRNIKQIGASVAWSWRLSPTLASNTGLSFTRSNFTDLNRTDRLTSFRIGLSKEFSPKMNGALNLSRLRNDSSLGSISYTENSLSATLGMRF